MVVSKKSEFLELLLFNIGIVLRFQYTKVSQAWLSTVPNINTLFNKKTIFLITVKFVLKINDME